MRALHRNCGLVFAAIVIAGATALVFRPGVEADGQRTLIRRNLGCIADVLEWAISTGRIQMRGRADGGTEALRELSDRLSEQESAQRLEPGGQSWLPPHRRALNDTGDFVWAEYRFRVYDLGALDVAESGRSDDTPSWICYAWPLRRRVATYSSHAVASDGRILWNRTGRYEGDTAPLAQDAVSHATEFGWEHVGTHESDPWTTRQLPR